MLDIKQQLIKRSNWYYIICMNCMYVCKKLYLYNENCAHGMHLNLGINIELAEIV